MKSLKKFNTASVVVLGGAMLVSYTNCGSPATTFTGGQKTSANASSSSTGSGSGPTVPGVGFCVPSSTTGGSGSGTPGGNPSSSGLKATQVFYAVAGQTTTPMKDFASTVANAQGRLSANLFLSQINLPNIYFTNGFQSGSGSVLRANDGSVLTEYFAFEASAFMGIGNLPAGDYQIATLTDDGSILTIKGGARDGGGQPTDLIINNDGQHSLRMQCATQALHLDANSRYPLTFDYFQGPAVTIGMITMIRPMPAGNPVDAQCGLGGSTDQYFFDDQNASQPSIAKQPYLDLISRGWKVLPASNFQLPDSSETNPCAP